MRIIFSVLLLTFALHAKAQSIEKRWFLHEFGELRSYHDDWLAVCANKGQGHCRIVNYLLKSGESFYGENGALTFGFFLNNGEIKNYLKITAPGVQHPYHSDILITFDYVKIPISGEKVLSGGFSPASKYNTANRVYDVFETFSILDQVLILALKDNMQNARWLKIKYNDGEVKFSLKGFSSAYRAIVRLRYTE